MRLQHTVRINVAQEGGNENVLQTKHAKLPYRLLRFLFGSYSQILILTPGKSVRSVEIHED
jgi:hypothetical protein